jgi:hypothetical protein
MLVQTHMIMLHPRIPMYPTSQRAQVPSYALACFACIQMEERTNPNPTNLTPSLRRIAPSISNRDPTQGSSHENHRAPPRDLFIFEIKGTHPLFH